MWRHRRSSVEKEFFETVRPSSLLKRFASIEEIASLVIFMASPLSAATNAAALRVDSGVTARSLENSPCSSGRNIMWNYSSARP